MQSPEMTETCDVLHQDAVLDNFRQRISIFDSLKQFQPSIFTAKLAILMEITRME
jgi:hypothetical protein